MFGIDKGGNASLFLSMGHGVKGQGCLSRRLGAENFDHTPTGQTADTQRPVQFNGSGGDDGNVFDGACTQLHDGALAELAFDLPHGRVYRLGFIR
jgi:hypothetical protein